MLYLFIINHWTLGCYGDNNSVYMRFFLKIKLDSYILFTMFKILESQSVYFFLFSFNKYIMSEMLNGMVSIVVY
jgi:hypothetical protein